MSRPSGLWEIVSITPADDWFTASVAVATGEAPPSGQQYWLLNLRRVSPSGAKKSQFIVAKDRLAVMQWAAENYELHTPLAWMVP